MAHQASGQGLSGRGARALGTKGPVLAPYQAFPTADGYLNVACANQKFWTQLCEAVDRPELVDDPRFASNPDRVEHMDALEAELAATFEQRSTEAWVELLAEEHGLPVGPVLTVPEALASEQTEARGTIAELEHPAAGSIPVIEHPLNFDGAVSGFQQAPPLLGEDTDAVLREAGYDDAAIEGLKAAGAIPDRG